MFFLFPLFDSMLSKTFSKQIKSIYIFCYMWTFVRQRLRVKGHVCARTFSVRACVLVSTHLFGTEGARETQRQGPIGTQTPEKIKHTDLK